VLDEPPGLVQHAQLQLAGVGRVLNPLGDAMQHIEQQGLEEGGVGPHGLEVEDLHPFERQGVFQVVEERRVAAALDPLVQPRGHRAGQQIGQCEQSALAGVEDIQVLDRLVDLPVLHVVQPVAVLSLQQDLHEGVQEVQVFRRRLERKGVD